MKIEVKKIKKGCANICFDCNNSVPDSRGHGCPWSRKFEPVPGWTEEPVILGTGKNCLTPTFHITACPMFDRDERKAVGEPTPIAVRCIETGEVFSSMRKAGKSLGEDGNTIAYATRNGSGYAFGFNWERVQK